MNQNLLIVDDEIEILVWLEEMFRYEFELEIGVYTANSALEALELLNNVKFDVVLTDIRKGLETDFQNLTKWLLTGLIDFDYISEESLLKIAPDSMEKNFRVGKMSYKVILVPSCLHLRKSTFLRLQNFARHGGQVIFAGDIPAFIDGERLEHPESIIPGSRCISLSEVHLMQEMKPYRQLEIRRESGEEAPFYLHQMREEGEQR